VFARTFLRIADDVAELFLAELPKPQRRDEETLAHRIFEVVGVGGHPVFEVEQPVGVVVDLILRGVAVNTTRSESNQEKIARYF
jgi:hypothetical protein